MQLPLTEKLSSLSTSITSDKIMQVLEGAVGTLVCEIYEWRGALERCELLLLDVEGLEIEKSEAGLGGDGVVRVYARCSAFVKKEFLSPTTKAIDFFWEIENLWWINLHDLHFISIREDGTEELTSFLSIMENSKNEKH